MPDPIAHYTFVPWLRQGVAARIDEADHLATQPDAGPLGRAGLSVEVVVDYVPRGGGTAAALPSLSRRVELLGPGDILGIKPNTVLRTEPYDNAVNATPDELAFVEFYEEDFPWRYTPARVATADEDPARVSKLRPWLALFVLRTDEFTLLERPGDLPVVTVNAGVALPPAEEAWAWAHAQIGHEVTSAADVHVAITSEPDRSLSRLMSPRRLLPDTAYVGFVVPAFETGRLAGLKQADPGTPAQKQSWGPAAPADRRFPVYFRWGFKTGTSGDFEALVRKLVAGPVGPRFGKREMAIDDVGYGMSRYPDARTDLEGALRPPDFVRAPFPASPGTGFAEELRAIVDLSQDLQRETVADLAHPLASTATRPSTYAAVLKPSAGSDVPDDPIVTPTAYGRFHADVRRIADAASDADLAWLRELNLDPRSRAAAGLGTEVVRQRQDELMERAWNQVGAIEAANQHMREAELAAAAGEALHGKHLATASEDRLLTLTTAAQRGLGGPATTASIRALVAASRVPIAAQSSTFKRVTRPQRRVMRRLTGTGQVGGVQGEILTKMNLSAADALSTARPKAEPGAAVALPLVESRVAAAVAAAEDRLEPKFWFLELLHEDLAGRLDNGQDLDAIVANAVIGTLTNTLGLAPELMTTEETALVPRVQALIDAITDVAADGPDGATVTITSSVFEAEFGVGIGGKSLNGVIVRSAAAAANDEIARSASTTDLQTYQVALAQFTSTFVVGRPLPAPAVALPLAAAAGVPSLAAHVKDRLHPRRALTERVAAAIAGLGPTILGRQPATVRPLRTVMASPVFDDPMFESLRRISQDYILPNVSDLPKDTITLMEPNTAFIEAYLAGLNVELARELLWREYPTDQRGTYARAFWDTRDAIGHPARPDIKPMHQWLGALGAQSQLPPETLVLVIRGELLQKYPNTIVYAHEAAWANGDPLQPRVLAANGEIRYPAFHATLEPDVAIFGFSLGEATARGHRRAGPADPEPDRPGWFFLLKERPGQLRFGADDALPAAGFQSWDDLAWDQITLADNIYARGVDAGAGVPTPVAAAGVTWGTSSAHLAYAMFQSPVLYARHAAEMLPPEVTP